MEDLLLYYIRCRVEERSPQGKLCTEKFYSGKPQKDDSDPTPLQCALVKMCKGRFTRSYSDTICFTLTSHFLCDHRM